MAKPAVPEIVSLVKQKQRKFTKAAKVMKEKIKKGVIKVKENIKPKKKTTKKRKIPSSLIYIAHLPYGFYEDEMTEYFQQFGQVKNVRVCRSKWSGRSKGYGFVEFRNREVAKIAAQTMDNYLMFNRRLVCKYVPSEKKTRIIFNKTPWSRSYFPAKLARKLHAKRKNNGKTSEEEEVTDKTEKVIKKINDKMEKLKKLGVYHIFAPTNVPDDMQHLLIEKEHSVNGKKSVKKSFEVEKIKKNCADLGKKSLKTIGKKKDVLKKKLMKGSFMQNDRLKRLATREMLNSDLVRKVDKRPKKRL